MTSSFGHISEGPMLVSDRQAQWGEKKKEEKKTVTGQGWGGESINPSKTAEPERWGGGAGNQHSGKTA